MIVVVLWIHTGNRGTLPITMHANVQQKRQHKTFETKFKNRRKINSREIMNRLLGLVTRAPIPQNVSRAHKQLYLGTFSRPKRAHPCISNMLVVQQIENTTKVRKCKKILMRNRNKAKPNLNMTSCNPMIDSDTLTKEGKWFQSVSK